jgi:hypothetical protein
MKEASQMAVFTAAQIAAALGISKDAVKQALEGRPAEQRLRNGVLVKHWAIGSLPEGLGQRLKEKAAEMGYRLVDELLAAPGASWQPPLALEECSEKAVDRAVKLREALAWALANRNEPLSRAEFEGTGLSEYQRVFVRPIGARQWWNLFNRTVERAGSQADYRRVELYLDERPARKAHAVAVQGADAARWPELAGAISRCGDPTRLTRGEKRAVWATALEAFEVAVELEGKSPIQVKRELLPFLLKTAPCLAANRNALRIAFERKHRRWKAAGCNAAALKDQRAEANRERAKGICQDDLDMLIGHTVLGCGGRISQGVRECFQNGWVSADLAGRVIANPATKSYVPNWLRERLRYEVAMQDEIHHGERQARDNGAYIDRCWDKVHSLDWFCGDDLTAPLYYWVPDGKGWFTLIRGQFLLLIDLRSTCILGYSMLPERTYNARVIRSLITRTCDVYGLPRRGFYFERGIWKDAKILTGAKGETPLSWQETEMGLREFGLKFIHAIRARSKPVERVLGAIQNMMEGLPGYCGRDEQHDGFEAFKKDKLAVESRRLDPRAKFLSMGAWDQKLAEICDRYNAEPQEGKMTCGLAPEEALERFKAEGDPPIRFDGACRYLLASHKRPVRVASNGVTLRFGKQVYNYRDENTGRLVGQEVLAWFDPDAPEILTVTDLQRRNAFCVARSQAVPAMDAPEEVLAQELGRIGAHMGYAVTRYRILKPKYEQRFRHNLVGQEAIELGRDIRRQTEAIRAGEKDRQGRLARARRAYGKLDMPVPARAIGRPEALEATQRLARFLADDAEPAAVVREEL